MYPSIIGLNDSVDRSEVDPLHGPYHHVSATTDRLWRSTYLFSQLVLATIAS